jgi:hypothetical protein
MGKNYRQNLVFLQCCVVTLRCKVMNIYQLNYWKWICKILENKLDQVKPHYFLVSRNLLASLACIEVLARCSFFRSADAVCV